MSSSPDAIAAYRALLARTQGAMPGVAGTTAGPPMAQLLQALLAARARKEPSRHIANLPPGESDHGNVSSAGRPPPPHWTGQP
jgi:hypothetical protein